MGRHRWLGIAAVLVAGCGSSHGTGGMDGAAEDSDVTTLDAGPGELDAGPGELDARPREDAGPEPCDPPGAIETVPCGNCGTAERFCTSALAWEYGPCSGEGVCEPGTTDVVACGNCGTQRSRCTTECAWLPAEPCTGEGVCMPGEARPDREGCPAGEIREITCNDACTFVESAPCAADRCETPGMIESVGCGMCGRMERFCSSTNVWEYGPCAGEGVCMPGSSGTTPCGMCGTQATRCSTMCTWEPTDVCMGEGECLPGTTTRTPVGCPVDQARLVRCNAACTYETVEACAPYWPVDVLLLLDLTGSNGRAVTTNATTFQDRLVGPLQAITDVAVGVGYYADFPQSPYGSVGDRPFLGRREPTTTPFDIATDLASAPTYAGGDLPESGIEALHVLSGGAPHPTAVPMMCSAGRVAGGCWRGGAVRVVVLFTDAPNHEGPDPTSGVPYQPYVGVSPTPATWTDVRSRLVGDGTELLVLLRAATGDAAGQYDRMLADLGQPSSNRLPADDVTLPRTLDEVVTRVRALAGR